MPNKIVPLSMSAPAKINIGLRVIRKRSDNYHDIETVFYPIHLADELEMAKSEKTEFFSNISLEADANLCLRALHLFCERTGINAEVKIKLRKNIPLGSGLGGGSSDAASVLLLLQNLYGNPLSEIELEDIAALLGSDVPYFLGRTRSGGLSPAFATGKGEVLEPLLYHVTYYILTTTPDVSVSTQLAYSLVTPSGFPARSLRSTLIETGGDYSQYKEAVVNDFEPAVFEKYPVIRRIKEQMYSSGAIFSLMSGSGSSVYGFFDSEGATTEALGSIRGQFSLRAADITPPHH